MAIHVGDVVFTNQGKPMKVVGRDEKTGDVSVVRDLKTIQSADPEGMRNGLPNDTRSAYKLILSEVKNPDVKQEIHALSQRIDELKQSNADARLLRYLENELQYKMVRERYQPPNFKLDESTVTYY